MERKIGEIFKFGGEWYQCVEDKSCNRCAFKDTKCGDISKGYCSARYRSDKKSVIFKKLEKVGEPYVKRVSDSTFSKFQRYKVYDSVVLPKEPYIYCNFIDSTVEIEIKQNKEDMEENKISLPKKDNHLTRIVYAYVNGKISDKELIKSIKEMPDEYPYGKNELKPFDLESAKAGKPVCTRDGRKARIICFDAKGDKPIIALIEMGVAETPNNYPIDGKAVSTKENSCDLMMLPEKKEGWVNIDKEGSGKVVISSPYSTKEEAIHNDNECTIDTIKINWRE